jgi:hypothetical protein
LGHGRQVKDWTRASVPAFAQQTAKRVFTQWVQLDILHAKTPESQVFINVVIAIPSCRGGWNIRKFRANAFAESMDILALRARRLVECEI